MIERRILVFAGTTEGRRLAELLREESGIYSCVCVATDYGKDILELSHVATENQEIRAGRLNEEEMTALMSSGFEMVIDSTHPYATEVTKNIRQAAEKTGLEYVRLLRPATDIKVNESEIHIVESTERAVELLNSLEGKVLLTVGSKELAAYTAVRDFKDRLYARVLPMAAVVKQCEELGFSGKNLICMQGPFSEEINIAMLKQYDCKYLVTKDTGKEGGAYEKYEAARKGGAKLIVIGRKENETGYTLEELREHLCLAGSTESNPTETESKSEASQEVILSDWFPMFVNIKNINILIVGAGAIAKRRISTLLNFSCNLCILGREISEEIKTLVAEKGISKEVGRQVILKEKLFEDADIEGFDMVLAATNSKSLNAHIGEMAKEKNILVNIADDKSKCDFYFPSVALGENVVIGLTAQGRNHGLAKKAGAAVRQILKENEKKWEEK